MQRKNSEQIEDNLEMIQTIEQHYRDKTQEVRIRMLNLLVDSGIVIVGC
jgi:hypothetical protein